MTEPRITYVCVGCGDEVHTHDGLMDVQAAGCYFCGGTDWRSEPELLDYATATPMRFKATVAVDRYTNDQVAMYTLCDAPVAILEDGEPLCLAGCPAGRAKTARGSVNDLVRRTEWQAPNGDYYLSNILKAERIERLDDYEHRTLWAIEGKVWR